MERPLPNNQETLLHHFLVKRERATSVLHALKLEKWNEPTAACLQVMTDTELTNINFMNGMEMLPEELLQTPISKCAKPKKTFVIPQGKYQFKTMLFGMMGAPAKFQEMMSNLLADVVQYASAYLDDEAIFYQTLEEHQVHIDKVLHRLGEAELTLNPENVLLPWTYASIWSYVGEENVEPVQAKVEAINTYTHPRTKKGVRAFLGLIGYYWKFVPHFSTLAR